MHHLLRTVANRTKETVTVPSITEIEAILESSFFLPTANKPAHRQLKDAARRLIVEYTTTHSDDLHRVWETERPFELHLDGVTVLGRADVDPRPGRRRADGAGHPRLQDLDEDRR